MSELESKVKKLIQECIQKRLKGLDQVDPVLDNFALKDGSAI
jgi:hypothetical protein